MRLLSPLALRSGPATSYWTNRLLLAPFSEDDTVTLPQLVREEGRRFLAQFDRTRFEQQRERLDRWYGSEEGQRLLVALFRQWWAQLLEHADEAMPAHDARHALLRVPAATLECIAADGVTGSGRLGVLGALFHDTGRWAEERLFGHPTESVFHARLGFLLARDWLSGSGLPDILADEVLHAVLTHTSGADPTSPLISRITVAGDRDQLHGPEYILRLVHGLAMPPTESFLPGARPSQSVLVQLLRMAGAPLPAPMPWLARRHDELHADSIAFVLKAVPAFEADPLFAETLARCHPNWLSNARTSARQVMPDVEGDVGYWALQLLAAPLVSPDPTARARVPQLLLELPPAVQRTVRSALVFAVARREQEDARLQRQLLALQSQFMRQGDVFCAYVAEQLHEAASSEIRPKLRTGSGG